MKPKTTLSFVVHKGKLETQALLLVASIKLFNKDQFNLLANIPKNFGGLKNGLSEHVKQRLISIGVILREIDNPIGSDYLIGNKLHCLSPFLNSEQMVFMDTDMMCTSPLTFPELEGDQFGAKPADRKTYHWDDLTWKGAYQKFSGHELKANERVFSTCFNELMFPYFNAGLIQVNVKHTEDFSTQWGQLAKALDLDELFVGKRPWLDQLALPLTAAKLKLSHYCLDETYNFPANIKKYTSDQNIKIVHYHKPERISLNFELMCIVAKIIKYYPWLTKYLEEDQDWLPVSRSIKYFCEEKNENVKSVLFCDAMSVVTDKAQLNSTIDVSKVQNISCSQSFIKPLLKRNIPWGIQTYLEACRVTEYLKEGKQTDMQVLHSNCIFAIEKIIQVLDAEQLIFLISHPVNTIQKWTDDYIGYLISEGWFDLLERSLSHEESVILNQVVNHQDQLFRKICLWRLLAGRLLKNRKAIKAILLEDAVEQDLNLEGDNEKIWQATKDLFHQLLRSLRQL